MEGTPEHLRDKEAAETYCQKAQEIAELWSALSGIDEVPEETQVLVKDNRRCRFVISNSASRSFQKKSELQTGGRG